MRNEKEGKGAEKQKGRPPLDKEKLRNELKKAGREFSRKITGTKSTCMISLPSAWVKALELKHGSELSLIIHGDDFGFLSVVPSESNLLSLGKAIIRVSSEEEEKLSTENGDSSTSRKILRKIVAAYLRGYSDIYIRMEEKNHKLPENLQKRIMKFETKLFGIQVLSSSSEEIYLWMSAGYINVKEILSKMCVYVNQMCNDIMKNLEQFDEVLAESIKSTDDTVDGLYHFFVRNLKNAARNPLAMHNTAKIENYRELMAYRLVGRCNERIADHCTVVAETLLELYADIRKRQERSKLKFEGEFLNLCRQSMDTYKLLMNSFSSEERMVESFESANEALAGVEALRKKEKEILKNLLKRASEKSISPEDFWARRTILQSIHRMIDYATTIGEITLNLRITSVVEE
jgi:phosphate uptake regulator